MIEVSGPVAFTVRAGEVVAVCGRGTTALLEAVSGDRLPARGRVAVGGSDPYRQRAGVSVGALWADGGLYGDLALEEIIGAWRRWASRPLDRDTVTALAALEGRECVPYSRLTSGERRRFDLALVLVSQPDALVIDEPATGLDPQEAREVWRLVKSLGIPVLVAARCPAEALKADRVVLLDSPVDLLAA
ncbi:ATP-binding cassette domain-containing protein [Actinocorallia populi]|uniref:ATP-binding cassette domain-containing protein n=1 Tax=Actinocorallia populi TaxID=2079200 RepID=UPI000D08CAAD|nr:ATP-binding cassette domain-containing protein [Actinocorallia populi]